MPVILLATFPDEILKAAEKKAGIAGYPVKPFSEIDVLPAVATALSQHMEISVGSSFKRGLSAGIVSVMTEGTLAGRNWDALNAWFRLLLYTHLRYRPLNYRGTDEKLLFF